MICLFLNSNGTNDTFIAHYSSAILLKMPPWMICLLEQRPSDPPLVKLFFGQTMQKSKFSELSFPFSLILVEICHLMLYFVFEQKGKSRAKSHQMEYNYSSKKGAQYLFQVAYVTHPKDVTVTMVLVTVFTHLSVHMRKQQKHPLHMLCQNQA